MGMFDNLERRIERATQRVFARTFRAEVQPVEIASALRRAMDDKATGSSRGRSVVPNVYTIELSETDYERLAGWGDELDDELVAAAEEHCDSQGYTPGGPLQIHLIEDGTLETGIFRLRPSTARTVDSGTPSAVARPSKKKRAPRPAPQPSPQPAAPAANEPAIEDEPYDDELDEPYAAAEPYAAEPAYDDDIDEIEGSAETDDDHGYAGRPEYDANPPSPDEDLPDEDAPDPAPAALAPPAPPAPPAAPPTPPTPKPRRVNPAERPWLEIDGERYILMGAITVLGRDESIDIILDDPGVSRAHSEFRVTTDGRHMRVTVRDLGSTNGTYVNSERTASTHLEDGDRITLGRTTAIFHAGKR